MGVTFGKSKSQKSAKKKRKGRRKSDLYCDGTLNEEVSVESFDSQTIPKVTYGGRNIEVESKNQELELKTKKIEELELRLREHQRKNENIEKIRAKILELEQENQQLRASWREVKIDSPYVAKPSVQVSDASTSTDQREAGEKRVRTAETATETDTEAPLGADYRSNTDTYCKANNTQVGNHNIMNIFGLITLGRYGKDRNADERTIRHAQLRAQELEKSNKSLQRELQLEKEKVEILRRQNEVLEASQTKMLETSLPFKTAGYEIHISFIRNLRYL